MTKEPMLKKNYIRAAWVVLTNGTLMAWLLTVPVRTFLLRQQISRAAGSPSPAFSYWRELIADPQALVLVLVLAFGIVTELRRSILAPILNLGLYAWCLATALIERAKVSSSAPAQDLWLGLVFVIIPLSAVLLIDVLFYATALLGNNSRKLQSP